MTKKISNRSGFTLIELVVVVAIIGILAAVTAPSLNSMIARSQNKAFARDIANQFRLARNQAASTNQAFVVRMFTKSSTNTTRGLIEVWAMDERPANCRSTTFLASGTSAPTNGQLISSFEGSSIGGEMMFRRKSWGNVGPASVCVQPNGEFLSVGGAPLPASGSLASKMCTGETMVIPLWTDPSTPDQLFDCKNTIDADQTLWRAQFDYWRVSLWDNGQVTVGRR